MSSGLKVGACALVLLLGSVPAQADTAIKQIHAAERAADAELANRERVCKTRFAVSSCLEQARRDHRSKVADLRSEDMRLDEAQRRSTAETRRRSIAEKLSNRQSQAQSRSQARPEVQAAPDNAPGPAHRNRTTPSMRPAPGRFDMAPLGPSRRPAPKQRPDNPVPKPSRPLVSGRSASSPESAAAREAAARRQGERFEIHDRQIETRKADALRRRTEREASGRLAAPLPLPPGASSPP